jgi:hypothetical protein
MANSMIADLLKTPAQVREQQLKTLREEGRSSAAMLTGMGLGGARTAVPGVIGNIAQTAAASMPVDMNQMIRRGLLGLGGVAKAAGKPEVQKAFQEGALSQQEREAVELNRLALAMSSNDPAKIKEASKRAQEMNRPDVAMKLQERLIKAEQLQEKSSIAAALTKQDPMLGRAYGAGELTLNQVLELQKKKPEGLSNYRDMDSNKLFVGKIQNGKVVRVSDNTEVPNALMVGKESLSEGKGKVPAKFSTKQLDSAFNALDDNTIDALKNKAGYNWNVFGYKFDTKDSEYDYLKEQVKYAANEIRKEGYDDPRSALQEAIRRLLGGKTESPSSSDPYAGRVTE